MINWFKKKLRKKKEKIKDLFYERLYNYYSLHSPSSLDGKLVDGRELIVSLTSYPKRFEKLHIVIESLMRQILKPTRVVLWLSKEEVPDLGVIPYNVRKYMDRGLEIRFVGENYRSYNKLVYAVSEFRESIIITVDDDTIYLDYFLRELYNRWLKYPDCIVAYSCKVVRLKDKRELMSYRDWTLADINVPSHKLIQLGYAGVLYPPGSLHDDVTRSDLFMELAPTADDIWFKAMALLRGTKVVMVYDRYHEFPVIRSMDRIGLYRINVSQNQNDIQAKRVFDYYDLYRYLWEDDVNQYR